jgi:hypothetical protein
MNRQTKLLMPILVAALLLASAPLAGAHNSAPASGSLSGTTTGASVRYDGPNAFVKGTYAITFTGALSGTCVGSTHIEVHYVLWGTIQGSCMFTGTANAGGHSSSGTAMINFEGKGSIVDVLTSMSGSVKFVIVGNYNSGLRGLHGIGSASATGAVGSPFSGSYSAQMHIGDDE